MTKIEWTEKTWNPVAGCTWASAGCDHCYAAGMTRRLEAMCQADYAGLTSAKHFNGQIRTLPAKLTIPLRRRKPTMWFVNSMSDLFHKSVPFEFIDQVFAVMAMLPRHTFQVLTKRPERMARYFASRTFNEVCVRMVQEFESLEMNDPGPGWLSYFHTHYHLTENGLYSEKMPQQWPLPNVWLGTSVENQEQADKRIPHLLQTPAAVRFLSIEPLLGAIELSDVTRRADAVQVLGKPTLQGIDWIIVGGESGPGARPMHPDWARSLRDQCTAAGVPFFFKQWGEWGDDLGSYDGPALEPARVRYARPDGTLAEIGKGLLRWNSSMIYRVGKKAAGRVLDGREWNEMPEVNRG